ncbi:MoxR family ATPase [Natrarchaeobius halalkaliphilus]|uniref:MoxR family ATPase n=1 Tax=Natrarchaeobius halalkaliphilus TaxID=1679091 RepID=A0A3N6LNX8_9EURY|nr:MoxR family ATPase [Natrarchaeobius halalkaliphilus]RQG91103.1 MoxR family ATPase [Natrarchaeobius halalkaliphilus]
MTGTEPLALESLSEGSLRDRFDERDYVADDATVTTVYLALQLERPLLVEGPPGSGKTELGKVLAAAFDAELIRLQCYEGLTAENALYEWNYTKQLLAVQANEGTVAGTSDGESAVDATTPTDADGPSDSRTVFDEEFLLERPLLRAIRSGTDRPPVLLIDEIDRADEEFEAFLLELLSDFQVSIPELGTVSAQHPPIVVLTSNRTRGLSDALKRRCLYLHVEPPSFETEYEIVRRKVPELDAAVAAEVCAIVERFREEAFLKRPGVAETLDWAGAVARLRQDAGDGSASGDEGDPEAISPDEIERTLGCLLKEAEDVDRVDTDLLEQLRDAAATARGRLEE